MQFQVKFSSKIRPHEFIGKRLQFRLWLRGSWSWFDISMTDTEGERCTSDTMRLGEILQEKGVALEVDNRDSKGTYTVT